MISKYYRVSVDIPDHVADNFKDSKEYERKVLEATKGFIEAGSEDCIHLEEWATFYELADAQRCEKMLMDVVYYFAAKLLREE